LSSKTPRTQIRVGAGGPAIRLWLARLDRDVLAVPGVTHSARREESFIESAFLLARFWRKSMRS